MKLKLSKNCLEVSRLSIQSVSFELYLTIKSIKFIDFRT
jgi:hypothetical protein